MAGPKAKFDKRDHRTSFKQLRIDQKDRFDNLAAESPQQASYPIQRASVFLTDPADGLFGVLGFDSAQQQGVIDQLRFAVGGQAMTTTATAEPAQRLAKLQSIKDLGLLDDAEYQRQRKRILDGI